MIASIQMPQKKKKKKRWKTYRGNTAAIDWLYLMSSSSLVLLWSSRGSHAHTQLRMLMRHLKQIYYTADMHDGALGLETPSYAHVRPRSMFTSNRQEYFGPSYVLSLLPAINSQQRVLCRKG